MILKDKTGNDKYYADTYLNLAKAVRINRAADKDGDWITNIYFFIVPPATSNELHLYIDKESHEKVCRIAQALNPGNRPEETIVTNIDPIAVASHTTRKLTVPDNDGTEQTTP